MTAPIRTAIRVEGIVQGVGFRPFVYTLATGLGLRVRDTINYEGQAAVEHSRVPCNDGGITLRAGEEGGLVPVRVLVRAGPTVAAGPARTCGRPGPRRVGAQ